VSRKNEAQIIARMARLCCSPRGENQIRRRKFIELEVAKKQLRDKLT